MFVLLVEQEELGITVGLQDRVIQVYEGLVYMDFAPGCEHVVDGLRCYRYEPMDPALLPPLYVAHHETLGEPTEVFHNNIRERFNRGDAAVVGAMKRFAELAAGGRTIATTARPNARPVVNFMPSDSAPAAAESRGTIVSGSWPFLTLVRSAHLV